jgi:group I intron endonuclease
MYLIYKIVNQINNKTYVGKTTQKLSDRWTNHLSEAKRWFNCQQIGQDFGYNSKLYSAMNKYGFLNFQIYLIEEVFSIEELNIREKFWIEKLQTRINGYNIAAGGDGGFFLGCHHTTETKEKIGAASKNKVVSEETRKKISIAKSNCNLSEATKEKIRKAHTGKINGKHSKEWCKHISEGQRNPIICVETNEIFYNIAEASRQTGILSTSICNCLMGRSKTAGKFHWKYLK